MKKRIILICGSTETLGYFSKQIGAKLTDSGYEVFYWDMTHPTDSRERYDSLPDRSESILITFNFLGLCGEGQFGCGISSVWERDDVEKICIMVDSPVYYYRQLSLHMDRIRFVCIDRNHKRFMSRFFPEYEAAFLPLCGNFPILDMYLKPGIDHGASFAGCSGSIRIDDYDLLPLDKRPIDMIFAGNYVTIDSIMPSLADAAPEYKDFIWDVAHGFISRPNVPLEDELLHRLKCQFPDEKEEAYPEAMYHMIFIDLYIRTYFRTDMIRTLVDEGYRVHLVGQDWDKLECRHPENIICTPKMMTSADCVNALEKSRISLNMQPWFKAGAHDRIFTSMLAGCVCVTDSSDYLDEILTPWEDHVPFTLGDKDSLLTAVDKIHKDTVLAQQIADKGRKLALTGHTWADFAQSLITEFNL